MEQIKRIAIDTSKHVFTLHGVDQAERVILRREPRPSADGRVGSQATTRC